MASSISLDFRSSLETAIDIFKWINPPQEYSIDPGKGLRVVPKEETDFWQRTYQTPSADRSSGHALIYNIPSSVKLWECTTQFSIQPCVQYDQAGIMVYLDDKHWIKAGIEFENDAPQMSCVVTIDQSDWNYFAWPTVSDVKVRVLGQRYEHFCECKVEYEQDGEWRLLRECALPLLNCDTSIGVGCMCCAPMKKGETGMDATFHHISIINNNNNKQ